MAGKSVPSYCRHKASGQAKWKTYFTPRNGDTLSWCVKLATRA